MHTEAGRNDPPLAQRGFVEAFHERGTEDARDLLGRRALELRGKSDRVTDDLARLEFSPGRELAAKPLRAVQGGLACGAARPDPLLNDPKLRRTNWDEMVAFADEYNDPGRFTALAAFEWSSQPNMSNLHRNVIFRDTKNLPLPFSDFDSKKPEDLWKWMEEQRTGGITLFAIPHNGNLSNGIMFATADSNGQPIDAAYAATRMRNEPVLEIIQTKGQSETHPMMAPNDEFAGFELWTKSVGGPGP